MFEKLYKPTVQMFDAKAASEAEVMATQIGSEVQARMQETDMSVHELADTIGQTPVTVQHILAGEVNLSIGGLARMAAATHSHAVVTLNTAPKN